jgi:hypothetical protein
MSIEKAKLTDYTRELTAGKLPELDDAAASQIVTSNPSMKMGLRRAPSCACAN